MHEPYIGENWPIQSCWWETMFGILWRPEKLSINNNVKVKRHHLTFINPNKTQCYSENSTYVFATSHTMDYLIPVIIEKLWRVECYLSSFSCQVWWVTFSAKSAKTIIRFSPITTIPSGWENVCHYKKNLSRVEC